MNAAAQSTMLPMLGNVEQQLIEAFKSGGGVPYASFEGFAASLAEMSAMRFDHNLVDAQVPLVPGIVEQLESGIDVARHGLRLRPRHQRQAKQWPNSRFSGYDCSEEAIERGRTEARDWGLANANHEVRDVSKLGGAEQFDLITTFDAVHDQADPAGMLASVSRLLRPAGTYLCADVGASSEVGDNLEHPLGPGLYTISLFHCMTVSLEQGGAGLGAMWGEQTALAMLADAGFTNVAIERVESDIFNNYYLATKE